MNHTRFTNDEFVQLIAELSTNTPQRRAYAQMLGEREVWETAARYLRELSANRSGVSAVLA